MLKKMQPLVLSTEQSGWVATSKLTKLSPAKMKAGVVATGAAALENLVAAEESWGGVCGLAVCEWWGRSDSEGGGDGGAGAEEVGKNARTERGGGGSAG